MLAENFRRNVDRQLRRAQLTRADLARRLGKTPQYVGYYLNAHCEPGLAVVERFAEALEIPPIKLLATPRKKASSDPLTR